MRAPLLRCQVAIERFAGGEVHINQHGDAPKGGWHFWKIHAPPPVEVLGRCFSYVNPRSLARGASACKAWAEEVGGGVGYGPEG